MKKTSYKNLKKSFEENKTLKEESTMLDYFESNLELTEANLTKILTLIQEASPMDNSIYVLANLYLQRIITTLTNPNKKYVLKIYLLSVLLAHKYLVDCEYWSLTTFGELIRVPAKDLEKMEVFLIRDVLEFDLFIKPERIIRFTQAYLK
jgi:hypothetical protein